MGSEIDSDVVRHGLADVPLILEDLLCQVEELRTKGGDPAAAMQTLYLLHPKSGPQGHRSDTMGHTLEASTQRLRHHLRRPHAGRRRPLK